MRRLKKDQILSKLWNNSCRLTPLNKNILVFQRFLLISWEFPKLNFLTSIWTLTTMKLLFGLIIVHCGLTLAWLSFPAPIPPYCWKVNSTQATAQPCGGLTTHGITTMDIFHKDKFMTLKFVLVKRARLCLCTLQTQSKMIYLCMGNRALTESLDSDPFHQSGTL